MVVVRKPPSRSQIAKVAGNDQELIRALQALFQYALELTPTNVDVLQGEVAQNQTDIATNVADIATNTAGLVTVNTRIDELEIDDLADVSAASPTLGMVLIYDATAGVWEANTITAGSNIAITNADGAVTVATAGATGSFTALSGQTVTVSNGIITSIV